MGKPLFKFFDVWSSQAAQFLSQLPMSPRLVEAARRSVGIMGSVAVRDRLCPLGRHFRELVQEFLPLFECRLSLEQLRESFPSLVVSVIRSEEHTSELQSHSDLVCRLLLEKKK